MKGKLLALATAAVLYAQAGAQPGQGANEPLLRSTDLVYEGAFRLAAGPCGGDMCTVDYGGEALSYSPEGNGGKGSLLATGFPPSFRVGEFELDAVLRDISPAHRTLAELPTAAKLQGWSQVLAGNQSKISQGGPLRLGGIHRHNGKLLVNVYAYFGQASTHTSLFLASDDFANPAVLGGPWEITGSGSSSVSGMCGGNADGCREGYTSGPIEPVPQNWQARLGGTHVVSGCCFPIISRTSHGPSVTAFNAADAGTRSPLAGTRLVGYPSEHTTLGNWDATNPGTKQWVGGTEAFSRSAVFAPGYRSLLFFGTLGTPENFCYGPPVGRFDEQGGVLDPVSAIYARGTDASTSADGRTVFVPNADLRGVNVSGNPKGQGIWLRNETTPLVSAWGRRYTATPMITEKGRSGTPGAYVKVSPAFRPNLKDQPYQIGERTCYDPASRGAFAANPVAGHSPFSYPYLAVIWAYDLNDLASVKSGRKRYWEPVPYDVITLTLPLRYPATDGLERKSLAGATYDPVRKKIYLAQQWVGSNFNVAITVWSVKAPGTPSARR